MIQNAVNFQTALQVLKKNTYSALVRYSVLYMSIRSFANHCVPIFYICATQSVVLKPSALALPGSCKLSGPIADPLN